MEARIFSDVTKQESPICIKMKTAFVELRDISMLWEKSSPDASLHRFRHTDTAPVTQGRSINSKALREKLN